MCSDIAKEIRLSLEDFLGWSSDDDTRYELVEGRVVAMSPPSRAHGLLSGNLSLSIGIALRKRQPCVLQAEAGIISPTRSDTVYQADLVVTCEPHVYGQKTVGEPLVVIEILSPSTESFDRKVKLADYRAIGSVEEILFVDQDRMFCELHRRLEDGRWIVELGLQPKATVRLEAIDVDITLSEIYANVSLDPRIAG